MFTQVTKDHDERMSILPVEGRSLGVKHVAPELKNKKQKRCLVEEKVFLIDMWESRARGKDIRESPEQTRPG